MFFVHTYTQIGTASTQGKRLSAHHQDVMWAHSSPKVQPTALQQLPKGLEHIIGSALGLP